MHRPPTYQPTGIFLGIKVVRDSRLHMSKWQPPATAHGVMFHEGYVWWLDTNEPEALFRKAISELNEENL